MKFDRDGYNNWLNKVIDERVRLYGYRKQCMNCIRTCKIVNHPNVSMSKCLCQVKPDKFKARRIQGSIRKPNAGSMEALSQGNAT